MRPEVIQFFASFQVLHFLTKMLQIPLKKVLRGTEKNYFKIYIWFFEVSEFDFWRIEGERIMIYLYNFV